MEIRVLGCGNILAGDDGVGVAVVHKLREKVLPANVTVLEAGAPGLSLVEMMSGAGCAILVDAILGGECVGNVRRYGEEELPPIAFAAGMSHGVGLREALVWARRCLPDHFPQEIVVVGVEIERPARFYEGLSPAVEAVVERAAQMVLRELERMNGKLRPICPGAGFQRRTPCTSLA